MADNSTSGRQITTNDGRKVFIGKSSLHEGSNYVIFKRALKEGEVIEENYNPKSTCCTHVKDGWVETHLNLTPSVLDSLSYLWCVIRNQEEESDWEEMVERAGFTDSNSITLTYEEPQPTPDKEHYLNLLSQFRKDFSLQRGMQIMDGEVSEWLNKNLPDLK